MGSNAETTDALQLAAVLSTADLNAFIGAVVLLLILRLVGGGWGYRRGWGYRSRWGDRSGWRGRW
jgi:hypothetical protein